MPPYIFFVSNTFIQATTCLSHWNRNLQTDFISLSLTPKIIQLTFLFLFLSLISFFLSYLHNLFSFCFVLRHCCYFFLKTDSTVNTSFVIQYLTAVFIYVGDGRLRCKFIIRIRGLNVVVSSCHLHHEAVFGPLCEYSKIFHQNRRFLIQPQSQMFLISNTHTGMKCSIKKTACHHCM